MSKVKYEHKVKFYKFITDIVEDANEMSKLGWELVSYLHYEYVINGNSVNHDNPWSAIYRKQIL